MLRNAAALGEWASGLVKYAFAAHLEVSARFAAKSYDHVVSAASLSTRFGAWVFQPLSSGFRRALVVQIEHWKRRK